MTELLFWTSVENAAKREAETSPLPGYYLGPADAYRHIVGVTELRRRFGFPIAYGIATGNEVLRTHERRLRGGIREIDVLSREMDDHNNAIGLEIGATARTYEEVVRRARAAIDAGIANHGNGADDIPRWLVADKWREGQRPDMARTIPVTWTNDIPSLDGYRFGEERFGVNREEQATTPRQREAALLDRLAATPTREWSEQDVRAVIGSTPYLNRTAQGHEAWRSRVQAYFEERAGTRASPDGGDDCTGTATVRPHTRRGPRGPVAVSGHTRSIACD
jgi:hypothetical protein